MAKSCDHDDDAKVHVVKAHGEVAEAAQKALDSLEKTTITSAADVPDL